MRDDTNTTPNLDEQIARQDFARTSPIEEVDAGTSVAPDELGQRFLRSAVQQERAVTKPRTGSPADSPQVSVGEGYMLNALVHEFRQYGGLVTHFPNTSDHERALSDLCRQAIETAHVRGASDEREVHEAARRWLLSRAEQAPS